jgi:sentrin-specific protease 7
MQQRVFIYNSFFFRCLEKHSFTKVRSWTRNVNIFDLDFLVVPINEKAHWYVAIICFPAALIKMEEVAKSDDEKDIDRETSCKSVQSLQILVFDSLGLAKGSRGKSVSRILLNYLKAEAADKLKITLTSAMERAMWSCPSLPQQDNFTDCGCFLVHYIERFLADPETVLECLLASDDLSHWFRVAEGTAKRAQMKARVEAMAADYAARHANDPVSLAGGSRDIEEIHPVD